MKWTPFTATQFIVLFYMLAKTQKIPKYLQAGKGGIGILNGCDQENCVSEKGTHRVLPKNCNVKPDSSKTNDEGKTQGGSFFKFGNSVGPISILDVPNGNTLPNGRTGSTRRTSLGHTNVVLKVADIFKRPEIDSELIKEALVYEQLKELQGKVIPKLVAHGHFKEGILHGFATSDCGTDLDNVKDLTLQFKSDAVKALQAIHEKGVLHNDIKYGNILENQNGNPMFIDFAMSEIISAGTNKEEFKKRQQDELEQLKMLLDMNE